MAACLFDQPPQQPLAQPTLLPRILDQQRKLGLIGGDAIIACHANDLLVHQRHQRAVIDAIGPDYLTQPRRPVGLIG